MRTKEYLKIIEANSLKEQKSLNMLNEDVSMQAADVQSGYAFIGDIINRYYERAKLPIFCDVQPSIGPAGMIYISTKSGNGARSFLRKEAVTELRDIKSRCTREYFSDTISTYGKDAYDLITQMIVQDNIENLDSIIIQKMKDIATIQSTLVLKADTTFGVKYSYSDIGAKIEEIALGMGKNTKRGSGAKVLVSAKVAGGLCSSKDIIRPMFESELERDYIGNLFGIYPVYVDTDNFLNSDIGVLVMHSGTNFGDKPLIVGHYSTNLHYIDGYSLEESAVNIRDRRSIVQNPIDTDILGSTGVNDSKFCNYFEVDFSNISNVDEFL